MDDSAQAPTPAGAASDGEEPSARRLARVALGLTLVGAGIGHMTVLRDEFQAQVPNVMPVDTDVVVLASGIAEILLGSALVAAPARQRRLVGRVAGAFFVAVFPGNVSQLLTRTDAFGLDSDRKRAVRLLFQPGLVAWALWSTGAWDPRCGMLARCRRFPPSPR